PPRCPACGGQVRPGVVWFGAALPTAALREAFAAACACDLLLSVGTSGVEQPAARIPGPALEHGATVVHVTPQPVRTPH
ncbi:Sir2 family NAD-dependent protein deacetylase, partial [Pseudomonas aeruginosa]